MKHKYPRLLKNLTLPHREAMSENTRNMQSSTAPSQVTTEPSVISSRGDSGITSLPFPSFGGITWIPTVSPEKEIQPNLGKTSSLSLTQDLPNVIVKTEDGIIPLDMQGYEELKGPNNADNGTGGRPLSNPDTHDVSQFITEEKALNLVGSVAQHGMNIVPQVRTNPVAISTDRVTIPKGSDAQAVDIMEYQSKLKQAVTKAKANKREKPPAVQPVFSRLITTDAVDSLAKTNALGKSEGNPNINIGTNDAVTSPLYVAVPLPSLPAAINKANNSTQSNITPEQYYGVLQNRDLVSQSHHPHDTYANIINLSRANLMKNTSLVDRLAPMTQSYPNDANGTVSHDVSQISVPEMYIDHPEKAPSNLNSTFVPLKFYKDNDLCGAILEAMWSMIEADVFWDAIIYVGMHSIKAHKLVLSSVCNLIHTRVISGDESVLKLRLPRDLDHKAVQSFVKYLYHGSIMITAGNVKDMYRLSNIFEMEALKKYVYDFCTEPVLARIILQCSKDTANDILFDEPEVKVENAEISGVEITNTTAELIENMDLEANEISIEFEKVEDKKEEVVFDWTGVDENESNIPIRKRGRSRKGVMTSITASKTIPNVDVPLKVDQTADKDSLNVSKSKVEHAPKVENVASKRIDIEKQPDTSSDHIDKVSSYTKLSKRLKALSLEKQDKEQEVVNKIDDVLPDPFDGGIFDESKLFDHHIHKSKAPVMMTRFRGTNRNVLKAAAKKKAKRNEGISNSKKTHKDKDGIEESDGDEQSKKKKPAKTPPKRSKCLSKRSTSPPKVSKPDKENMLSTEVMATSNVKDTTAEPSAPLSLVKKGRAKRSVTELEIPKKSEAVMRQPPKKRTKEISEMMKNVDKDLPTTVAKLQDEDEPSDKKIKEKDKSDTSNLRLPKTPLLMESIAKISDKGLAIEGERMYRCEFCGNEYLCAKRALTHVVKNHGILLDEGADHVTVHKKNLSPKMCDVCGYKAKDCNIYYIHFHKYFRHGVALPHGWTPHKCDLCQKEFYTKFQLKEHKLAHFEDTPFICQHCGMGFRTRTGLNSHMFHKHSKEKKHACTECTKTFKTRTQMMVHSRTHSGSKPFACTICMYRSTTRGNMRLHLTNRHKLETDVIKGIMENLKATEQVISVDEDGNVIKMKESGFAVKLGASDGQALQIDPAGSAETQSMDTLAHVAAIKTDTVQNDDMLRDVAQPSMQDQAVMTDIEDTRPYDVHARNRLQDFTGEKRVGLSELPSTREEECINQNLAQPIQLVVTGNEIENQVEMRLLQPDPYPIIESYRSLSIGVSEQDQGLLSDNRLRTSSADVQESRMIVRNVLQRFDQRPASDTRPFSLLKEALAQSPVPSFDPRDGAAAAEIIDVSEAFFQENNMLLNQQTDQIGGASQADYASTSRSHDYETTKDDTAEPLQLVMNDPSLQNKQAARQFSQSYAGLPAFSKQYYVKTPNKAIFTRLPEIPTIIPEDIQQLEHLPLSDQPQISDKGQGYDLAPKSETEPNTQEQQLMYDDYYQQGYQHGYQ